MLIKFTSLTLKKPRSHRKMAFFGALCLWASAVSADTVTLNNGNTIEGLIIQQSSQSVEIRTQGGSMVIPMTSVASVAQGAAWDFHIANGDQLFQQGRLERALEAYHQARALAEEAGAFDEDMQAEIAQRMEAVREQVTALSAHIFNDVLERVESFVGDRLYDEAFELLQITIDESEEGMPIEVLQKAQAAVLLVKAERLLDMVNTRDARAVLRLATELDPGLMEAHRILGVELSSLNLTDQVAIIHLTQAIALMDEETSVEMISNTQKRLGQCLQESGRHLEASDAYEQVFERSPWQHPDAQRRAVDNLMDWANDQPVDETTFASLADALTHAHELDSSRVEPLNLLVTICQLREDFSLALRHCRRSLQIEANQASMYKTLGDLILAVDSTNRIDAESAYYSALRYNPNIYAVHCALAALKERAGEYEQALVHCDMAIELTDQFARAYILRGKTLIAQDMDRNANRAIRALREAISKSSRYIEPHLLLGEIYIHKQEYNTARDQYENAIDLISERNELEDDDVQRLIADCHIGLGRIHLIQRKINQALDQAQQALEINPNYSWAHSLIGEIEEASENSVAAEAAYARAIESEPTEPQFYYLLGLVYYERLRLQEGDAELLEEKAAENFCLYLSTGGADYITVESLMTQMERTCN